MGYGADTLESGEVHDRGDVSPDRSVIKATPKPIRPKVQTDWGITTIPQQDWMKVLIYGDSGSGKTHLAGTADDCEALKPVLYCDADIGILTLRNRKDLAYKKLETLDDAFTILRMIRLEPDRYKTVVLDGLMSMYTRVMADRLRQAQDKPGHDPYVPQMQDWLHCQFRMRALLAAFRDQPINFIATTCATRPQVGEEEGAVSTVPDLPGKLADQVGQMFDLVGYLYTRSVGRDIKRMLQIQPFKRTVAKNRSPFARQMGPILEEPTMVSIYQAAVLGDFKSLNSKTPDKARDESEA